MGNKVLLRIVAADALVLEHQGISNHNTDPTPIVNHQYIKKHLLLIDLIFVFEDQVPSRLWVKPTNARRCSNKSPCVSAFISAVHNNHS